MAVGDRLSKVPTEHPILQPGKPASHISEVWARWFQELRARTDWVSALGAVAVSQITPVTTDRLIGRDTAGSGAAEQIAVTGGLEFTGSQSIRRAALTGDVTAAAGGTVTTIANDAVTDAKLRNAGALSVIGRSANSSGDPADIAAVAASAAVLRESGSVLGFGQVATAGIADDAVTFPKMRNIDSGTVIGRDDASTGDPEALVGRIIYTGSGHPQGVVSLPLGSRYCDTGTGQLYGKFGGGTTAYGWYPIIDTMGPGGVRSLQAATWQASDVATGIYGIGIASPGIVTPSGTTVKDTDGYYMGLSTGAASGNYSGWYSGGSDAGWTWDDGFDLTFRIKTGSDIADSMFWIGTHTAFPVPYSNSLASRAVMLRYSTSVPDGGWVGVTHDGATQNVTATVATIAADTVYTLRIRLVSGTAYFSVNDGTEVSTTTNVPTGTVVAGTYCVLYTILNQVRSFFFRTAGMAWGSMANP